MEKAIRALNILANIVSGGGPKGPAEQALFIRQFSIVKEALLKSGGEDLKQKLADSQQGVKDLKKENQGLKADLKKLDNDLQQEKRDHATTKRLRTVAENKIASLEKESKKSD